MIKVILVTVIRENVLSPSVDAIKYTSACSLHLSYKYYRSHSFVFRWRYLPNLCIYTFPSSFQVKILFSIVKK